MTAKEQPVLDIYQGILLTLKLYLSLNPVRKDLFSYTTLSDKKNRMQVRCNILNTHPTK